MIIPSAPPGNGVAGALLGGVRANRVGEVLRKMFSLAVTWKMRTDNPATSFRKRPETARERFLSFDEIQRLADALCADPDHDAGQKVGAEQRLQFTITSDMPAATQLLSPRNYMNTGAAAAAVAFDCSGVYVETDY